MYRQSELKRQIGRNLNCFVIQKFPTEAKKLKFKESPLFQINFSLKNTSKEIFLLNPLHGKVENE